MNLNQPYYIEKRKGNSHISLDGEWDFCYRDNECSTVDKLIFEYKANIPESVYYNLYHANILPDPYFGSNSRKYHWVDEKIWYYKRRFTLNNPTFCGKAFLCFDGISYYSRLWVNNHLIGEHEGMFGGPCCEIKEFLNFDGENEIIVEVKACNFGNKDSYVHKILSGETREIVPWNISRDDFTSNGDFIVMWIWNSVRLELLPDIHISRPYIYTKSIDDNKANIHLELEVSDGSIRELREYYGKDWECCGYTRAYDSGLTGKTLESAVEVEIKFRNKNKIAYYNREIVPLTDFEGLGMDKRYFELQFYQKDFTMDNPKLWYPNGLGEPFLYDVEISVFYNDKLMDQQNFKFGIRTFDADYTAGNKYRSRWERFLFSVNGQKIFLKGMNWTPIDFLYDISPDRYEWCLRLVKNAGIQLLRVWNGGGMQETDTFYSLCDELGIMVWQDQFIANSIGAQSYPQNVLEDQTAYNLYRIRNHPSLVILCGGNEFCPYTEGCAASMFIIERTVRTLAPDRIFHYTTADKGSAHIYIDMEPVWYRHRYKQLPFLAESGIHSFPTYKTLKKYIRKEEADSILPDLSSAEFSEKYPDLLNHFSEYVPERVPRMTSRISQITDLSGISLQELCEASQVQAYEFYQLMIQAMHENFPFCGGVQPWVFKRPWATVGIQTVDGDDRPGFAYYAVLNSYKLINVCWCQEWSVIASGETLPLTVKVFNDSTEDLSDTVITLTLA